MSIETNDRPAAIPFYFSPTQTLHRPTQYGVHGRIVAPLENPNRAEALAASLREIGLEERQPSDERMAAVLAVHSDHYVDYLKDAFDRFQALPNAGPEVLPNVHPQVSASPDFAPRGRPKTTGILGQTGWYVGDLSCAITADTFTAASASAQTARAAADAILDGAPSSFALCRPPGHHAYADRASGFCFFNNAAIAAERLRSRYDRVAILDFDTHHGDGTQAIFYRRGDVVVASLHTDPSSYYPHFCGYADECGAGDGEGYNLNRPLPLGSGDEAIVAAAADLCETAVRLGAQAIVLSAGWDAHREDPLSKLDVSTDAYARLGDLFGQLRLPTVIVQEGGYSIAAISQAAPLFVQAFAARHG